MKSPLIARISFAAAIFVLGMAVGTAASALSFGGTVSSFFASMILSPVVMTIGAINAAIHGPSYLAALITLGFVAAVVAFLSTVRSRSPVSIAFLSAGAAMWASGNEYGLQMIMSV